MRHEFSPPHAFFIMGERPLRHCYFGVREFHFFITHIYICWAATQNARLSNENVTEMQRRQKVEMNGERQPVR